MQPRPIERSSGRYGRLMREARRERTIAGPGLAAAAEAYFSGVKFNSIDHDRVRCIDRRRGAIHLGHDNVVIQERKIEH